MPYRLVPFWGVIVGLLGVIAIGVLVATRKDWRRVTAEATGWRRKLLVAGLAMLGITATAAMEGCVSCYEPMPVTAEAVSRDDMLGYMQQLSDRIALAEAALANDRLDRQVGREVIDQLWQARGEAIYLYESSDLTSAEREQLATLGEEARLLIEQLEQHVDALPSALGETAEWQALDATWREAEEIASGPRDSYPFTEDEKLALLSDLDSARADLVLLERKELLTQAEGDLLASGLVRLAREVECRRPTEMQGHSCYIAMPVVFGPEQEWERLQNVAGLMDVVLAQEVLTPAAAEKVLQAAKDEAESFNVDHTLDPLISQLVREDDRYAGLTKEEMVAVLEAQRNDILTAIVELQGRLDDEASSSASQPARPGPEETAEWQRLDAVWREAEEIIGNERGPYPFTEAEKAAFLDEMAQAQGDISELVDQGGLTEAEGGLLADELTRLTGEVREFRPVEMQMATCYEPMPASWFDGPARWAQLQDITTMLNEVVDQDVLAPAVAAKILQSIQDDLADLQMDGYKDQLARKLTAADSEEYAGYTTEEMMLIIDSQHDDMLTAMAELQVRLDAMQETE